MKTIRVFTVKVDSCTNCPDADNANELDCLHDYTNSKLAKSRLAENVVSITPSCPRYAESKLIEVKE